jgi:hypothetical protein
MIAADTEPLVSASSAFSSSASASNAQVLENEIAWLAEVIDASMRIYFGNECRYRDVREIPPPDLSEEISPYARAVRDLDLSADERIILMLALAPHVKPQVLDPFLVKNPNLDRAFSEFGGVTGHAHTGFLPTVETAAFLLAGTDLGRRFAVQDMLEPQRPLRLSRLLDASHLREAEPRHSHQRSRLASRLHQQLSREAPAYAARLVRPGARRGHHG